MRWKDSVVFLEILSFRGVGVGIHFYGHLKFEGNRLDIERSMTPHQAANMNKLDGTEYIVWKAGDKTSRLDTREEAYTLAKATWKQFAPTSLALVQGSTATAQPIEILEGLPEEQLQNLNKIWTEFEEHTYGGGPEGLWDDKTNEFITNWENDFNIQLEILHKQGDN